MAMTKGRQLENFEYLGTLSDTDFLGETLCDDFEFNFDVYAPANNSTGPQVNSQGVGEGRYDAISNSPGLHVRVSISEDGGEFEEVAILNVTGPTMYDFYTTDDGVDVLEQNYRGHSVIADPVDAGTPDVSFLKYSSGNFQYVGTVEDNFAFEDLNGHGQLMDFADWFC
jgi:hypothetical protein